MVELCRLSLGSHRLDKPVLINIEVKGHSAVLPALPSLKYCLNINRAGVVDHYR